MKKKFLSVLLTLAMVLAMIPMSTGGAWAASNGAKFTVGGINYKITSTDTNTVEVSDNSSFASDTVIIPATVEFENVTYTVTSIGEKAFRGCNELANIEIQESVTIIDECAFLECTKLKSVTFADNSMLMYIYMSAFDTCNELTNITIPAHVTFIGKQAFHNCLNLATVTCLATTPPELRADAFASCTNLTSIYVPADKIETYKLAAGWTTYADNIKTTAEGTYLNPWQIGATTPSNVNAWLVENTPATDPKTYTLHIEGTGDMKQLGPSDEDRPWNGYKSSISSVQISEGITSICDVAFKDCTALTNVTIPASVASIIDCAFKECTSLTTVTCLATTPPALGINIFDGCTSLAAIYVPYEAVEAYKSAAGWSAYVSKIQAIPGTEPQAPSIGYFVYDVAQYNAILAEAQKLQAEIDAKLAEEKQTEEEKPVGTPITEEQAKALVTEMVPVVRTENQARGIMVVIQDSPAINKLKASGFKVLYDFYRAESSTVPTAADYKITKVVNKEEPWYLNTAAQAGKKYYYKVIAKVYDKDGNLVEETEIGQAKYGMRTRK